MAPNPSPSPPSIPLNMNPFYDITYDVPKRIHPDIPDLTSRVTLHTLNTTRHILHEDGRLLFSFPYHEDIFWTNIKYVCHGTDPPFSIGIVAIAEDGAWREILPSEPRPAATWLDTNWALPSMPKSHLYVTVKPQDPATDLHYLRIKILGFARLFPSHSAYALVEGRNEHPVIVFSVSDGQAEQPYPIRRIQDYPSPQDAVDAVDAVAAATT